MTFYKSKKYRKICKQSMREKEPTLLKSVENLCLHLFKITQAHLNSSNTSSVTRVTPNQEMEEIAPITQVKSRSPRYDDVTQMLPMRLRHIKQLHKKLNILSLR